MDKLICTSCPHCLPTGNGDPGNSGAIPHQRWLCYANTQNGAAPLAWGSPIAKRKKPAFVVFSSCINVLFPGLNAWLLYQNFAKCLLGIKDWEHKAKYGLVPAVTGHPEQRTLLRWLHYNPVFLRKRPHCCPPPPSSL